MNSMILRDMLHVGSERAVSNDGAAQYARGAVVGVVAGLMSTGMSWKEAFELVEANLPNDPIDRLVPETWAN